MGPGAFYKVSAAFYENIGCKGLVIGMGEANGVQMKVADKAIKIHR